MQSERKAEYLGFEIKFIPLAIIGDGRSALLKVIKNEQKEFSITLKVSRSAMLKMNIGEQSVEEFLYQVGNKIVRGLLASALYQGHSDFVCSYYESGIDWEPKLETSDLMLEEDELFSFYLLQALKRIRKEYSPRNFENHVVNVYDLCFVLGIDEGIGYSAIRKLEDKNAIDGIQSPSPTTYGAFDFQTMYITLDGLIELDSFEKRIQGQLEANMDDIYDDFVIVLKYLSDKKIKDGQATVSISGLRSDLGLSEEQYGSIGSYLTSMSFVKRTLGGDEGQIWITQTGIQKLNEEFEKRIKLSLNAMRISKLVAERTMDPAVSNVPFESVLDELGINESEYRIACRELEDNGILIESISIEQFDYAGINLTPHGRNLVRSGFKKQDVNVQQQIGAVFQGPVNDSNIQAIAVASNSNISQAIQDGDIDAIKDEMTILIEQLVNVVKPDLDIDELKEYAEAATNLRDEINRENPEPSKVQKLIGVLNFAGNVDGAIELGKKGIELAIKVSPIIVALQEAALRLLN